MFNRIIAVIVIAAFLFSIMPASSVMAEKNLRPKAGAEAKTVAQAIGEALQSEDGKFDLAMGVNAVLDFAGTAYAPAAGVDNTLIKGFEALREITPGLNLQSINTDNVSAVLIMALHDALQDDIKEIFTLDVTPTYPDMRSMLERRAKDKIRQWQSEGLSDILATKFPGLSSQKEIISTALQDDEYITAVAVRGAEAALTASIDTAWQSPVLQISPQPLDAAEINGILGDRPNMVVVAGYLGDLFQDELYALSADVADGGMNTNVLGVLENWLTADAKAITRAILVDNKGVLREVSFIKPVPVDIACVLHHQIGEEQHAHQRLSNRFEVAGIQQVNPYEAARQVDSKWLSMISWRKAGLAVPRTTLITNASVNKIAEAVAGLSSVVVKPEHGTEGIGVEPFQPEAKASVATHVTEILRSGDNALIQERRGNILYIDPQQPELGPREITLRVNVEWDGTRYVANTGFAQVAAEKGAFPASRGRGGSVKDINEVLANIAFVNPDTGEEQRLTLSGSDIDAIVEYAIRAVEALYGELTDDKKPKLVGIDMVLEKNLVSEGVKVMPVLLEGNSRPAGLANSTVIKRPGDSQEVEYRATTAIWNWAETIPLQPRVAAGASLANAASATGNMGERAPAGAFLETFSNLDAYPDMRQHLAAIYGPDNARLQEEADRYIRSIKCAINGGMVKPSDNIIVVRVPGRLRGIGNAHDYLGVLADGVVFVTEQDLIMIVTSNNDNVVRLSNLDPVRYPSVKPLALDDYMIKPDQPITTVDEWDAWVKRMHASHPDDPRLMIKGKTHDKDRLWFNGVLSNIAWQVGHGREIGGLNVFVGDSNVPSEGGLSSSSTLPVATSLALNSLYDWGRSREEMAEDGLCERHYFGTEAGYGDHAAILFSTFREMTKLALTPHIRSRGQVVFPEDQVIYLLPTGIDRQLIAHLISRNITEEAGSMDRAVLDDTRKGITTRTGIAGRLTLLYFKEMLKGRLNFNTIGGLFASSYDEGTVPSNLPTEREIKDMLSRTPERINKEALLADLQRFKEVGLPGINNADIDALIKTVEGLSSPSEGFRLRGWLTYFISMVPKIDEFISACARSDAARIYDVIKAYHNGERVYSFVDNPTGAPYDGTPSDGVLQSDITLWRLEGERERSLEPVDYAIDTTEDEIMSWFIETTEAGISRSALIIAAAGLGGQIQGYTTEQDAPRFERVVIRNLKRMFAYRVVGRLLEDGFHQDAIDVVEKEVCKPLRSQGKDKLADDVFAKVKGYVGDNKLISACQLVEAYYMPVLNRFPLGQGASVISIPATAVAKYVASTGPVTPTSGTAGAAGEPLIPVAIGDVAVVIEPKDTVRAELIRGLMMEGFSNAVGFPDMEAAAVGIQEIKASGNSIGLVVNNTGLGLPAAIAAGIGPAAVVAVPDPAMLQEALGSSA